MRTHGFAKKSVVVATRPATRLGATAASMLCWCTILYCKQAAIRKTLHIPRKMRLLALYRERRRQNAARQGKTIALTKAKVFPRVTNMEISRFTRTNALLTRAPKKQSQAKAWLCQT